MSESPFEPLLHRELHIHDATEHYATQISLLRDVVNYGTKLIPACYKSSATTLADLIVIPVLLKQIVMMLDAFEVLVSGACAEASVLQVRAMYEASLYIDWILESDSERKALHYHVANVRRELQWTRRVIEGDPERESFLSDLGEFADAIRSNRIESAIGATDRLKRIEEFLAKEPYAEINQTFEAGRKKSRPELAWYIPLGQKSVRSIAKALNRLHEYEFFYGSSSEMMHGSRHKTHITINTGGSVTFEPIRHLKGLANTIRFAVFIAIHSYRVILRRYRPGQLDEFARRYLNDWRDPFLTVRDITYRSVGRIDI